MDGSTTPRGFDMAGARVSVDLAPSKLGRVKPTDREIAAGSDGERFVHLGARRAQNEPRGVRHSRSVPIMDFHGQVLAERMYQIILVMAGIIAFVAGYTSGSFDTMAHVFFCGLIVAVILCVPDWNYFNQHPVKWLPIDEDHPDWETVYKPQLEEKQGKGKAETKKKR